MTAIAIVLAPAPAMYLDIHGLAPPLLSRSLLHHLTLQHYHPSMTMDDVHDWTGLAAYVYATAVAAVRGLYNLCSDAVTTPSADRSKSVTAVACISPPLTEALLKEAKK